MNLSDQLPIICPAIVQTEAWSLRLRARAGTGDAGMVVLPLCIRLAHDLAAETLHLHLCAVVPQTVEINIVRILSVVLRPHVVRPAA